ncbi:hypothetical protein ABZ791_03245 [Streptomyces huasconensis]|uniref:Uncharacterized protein n=1 Tax=Streptomyces huasconensis TaxID=1854574 RepID=A0ABV3LYA3_9ACTN
MRALRSGLLAGTLHDCAAPAPGTRDELEHSSELPCPEASLPLTDRDTLFLSSFPGGWKAIAAGCTPRPEKPYQCRIKGG